MIKAISAPYVGIHFVPTGGINAENLIDYLNFPMVAACGGSWMVSRDLIRSGAFDRITELVREAVAKMLGFEVRHIGINATDEKSANSIAAGFEKTFGFSKNEGAGSIFAGSGIEIMKNPGLGAKGHIAMGTNYIKRAVYHLEKRGVQFAMDTATYDAQGYLKALYLQEEMGGFAVHLLQK
jgi:2-dehydro-3-deoxyphosphogluconate aldolase/(4S)-4-hydroxy-2-oxoglutarate aldolase